MANMRNQILLFAIVLFAGTSVAAAQQRADLQYEPPLPRPAYEPGSGPRIMIDEAHHNFHTADGRYKPFALLLRRDGYRVDAMRKRLSSRVLEDVQVLVIANALHRRNVRNWSLPTPSAFSEEEIVALHTWVEAGGSLFLIADHMPFPGAAAELAEAFGVVFSNGYARRAHGKRGKPDIFKPGAGLEESVVTMGRTEAERVTVIATFAGSAFQPPKDATPILVFDKGSVSVETEKAPGFTPNAARIPIEGWCQGAAIEVGKGRVVVFGEAAMFSAQFKGRQDRAVGMNAPEAGQNHQLLLNVIHWLSRETGISEDGKMESDSFSLLRR